MLGKNEPSPNASLHAVKETRQVNKAIIVINSDRIFFFINTPLFLQKKLYVHFNILAYKNQQIFDFNYKYLLTKKPKTTKFVLGFLWRRVRDTNIPR